MPRVRRRRKTFVCRIAPVSPESSPATVVPQGRKIAQVLCKTGAGLLLSRMRQAGGMNSTGGHGGRDKNLAPGEPVDHALGRSRGSFGTKISDRATASRAA